MRIRFWKKLTLHRQAKAVFTAPPPLLQIDCAGWHGPENLAVPDGIRLVYQPSHSPELQPAECDQGRLKCSRKQALQLGRDP
jgi:hypothetical protein